MRALSALLAVAQAAASCDLCARDFVFILATGRSGSTSVLEAVNSLPGVNLRGENDATLLGAMDLYNRSLRRGTMHSAFAAKEHGKLDTNTMLCSLQDFFVAFDPPRSSESVSAEAVQVHGFKELISGLDDNPEGDEQKWRNANRNREWPFFFETLFPCGRIVLNYRDNTTAQADSTFFKRHGTTSAMLDETNEFMRAWHADLTAAAAASAAASTPHRRPTSYLLPLEQLTAEGATDLARFLGFQHCKFLALPHANDPDVPVDPHEHDPHYHGDYDSVQLECAPPPAARVRSASTGFAPPPAARVRFASRAPASTVFATAAATAPPAFDRVYYINAADQAERREYTEEMLSAAALASPIVRRWNASVPSDADVAAVTASGKFDGTDWPYLDAHAQIGTLGCLTSHKSLLRHLIRTGRDGETYLVLEDDARLPAQFEQTAREILAQYAPTDWDVLRLGCRLLLANGDITGRNYRDRLCPDRWCPNCPQCVTELNAAANTTREEREAMTRVWQLRNASEYIATCDRTANPRCHYVDGGTAVVIYRYEKLRKVLDGLGPAVNYDVALSMAADPNLASYCIQSPGVGVNDKMPSTRIEPRHETPVQNGTEARRRRGLEKRRVSEALTPPTI